MPLADAINALAFESHPEPMLLALEYLCAGEWEAQGDWEWMAFFGGELFHGSEVGRIPALRWQHLRKALSEGLSVIEHDDIKWRLNAGLSIKFKGGSPLPNLGHVPATPSEEMADWAWRFNRFETALLTESGREEWFSAVSIEVFEAPNFASPPLSPPRDTDALNKGGRPATYDWEALLLAMAGRCYVEGWKPATQAAVIKAMQEWATERGLPEPNASTARPKAKAFFDAFMAWEKAANENLG